MPRSLRLIGTLLIATSLSSCSLLRELIQQPDAPSSDTPPVVNDQPRSAPCNRGRT